MLTQNQHATKIEMDRPDRTVHTETMAAGRNNGFDDALQETGSITDEVSIDQISFSERMETARNSIVIPHRPENRKPTKLRKKQHCALFDGSPRYADKSYSDKKPRPYSPELLAYYHEQTI